MYLLISYSFMNRRFVWNFFRLENEHLNNCGKFRAMRNISVAPDDCSDQIYILRMMDTPNGVTNRRRCNVTNSVSVQMRFSADNRTGRPTQVLVGSPFHPSPIT